ncbi:MAG: Holliday junction resolvase RuvX [Lachnospiraceae bacterium]|nr:Holliday junction resolvase RuvX [Lachnospiraceae bacterium]
MAKRIMGLDFGSRTVGVAVSDSLGITAQGVETIKRPEENKLRRTLARLEELIKEYQIEEIVVGCPRHMNGDFGERAEKSEAFAKKLKSRTGLPVALWDERLTTVAAERVLKESGVRRERRKDYVDKIAAVFILQGYLDSL